MSRRQRVFPFAVRRFEHERQFKLLIALATLLAIVLIVRLFPWGRYLSDTMAASARHAIISRFRTPPGLVNQGRLEIMGMIRGRESADEIRAGSSQ